mmetsp:Transcript_2640/g.5687  ORF Transcript_2640/g.5687 Transcript_2640/m.5687 type:complete len:100 (+) Transcript_2640:26-325(+)
MLALHDRVPRSFFVSRHIIMTNGRKRENSRNKFNTYQGLTQRRLEFHTHFGNISSLTSSTRQHFLRLHMSSTAQQPHELLSAADAPSPLAFPSSNLKPP